MTKQQDHRSDPPHFGRLPYLVATTCGLGDRLPAPGTTAGSLPAILAWLAVQRAVSPAALLAVTLAMTAAAALVGVWSAGAEARRRGREDPGPVVIDEVAGQWLTCAVALPWAGLASPRQVLHFAAAAFVLFRVFDVLKPWPVRRLERYPGGWGIMADDLAAGLEAGLVLLLGLLVLRPG